MDKYDVWKKVADMFEQYNDEYLKHQDSLIRLNKNDLVHVILYLQRLTDEVVNYSTGHEIIQLDIPIVKYAKFTKDDVIHLLRAGVHWDNDGCCMCMYT